MSAESAIKNFKDHYGVINRRTLRAFFGASDDCILEWEKQALNGKTLREVKNEEKKACSKS